MEKENAKPALFIEDAWGNTPPPEEEIVELAPMVNNQGKPIVHAVNKKPKGPHEENRTPTALPNDPARNHNLLLERQEELAQITPASPEKWNTFQKEMGKKNGGRRKSKSKSMKRKGKKSRKSLRRR
jgi:hypothetical protein